MVRALSDAIDDVGSTTHISSTHALGGVEYEQPAHKVLSRLTHASKQLSWHLILALHYLRPHLLHTRGIWYETTKQQ